MVAAAVLCASVLRRAAVTAARDEPAGRRRGDVCALVASRAIGVVMAVGCEAGVATFIGSATETELAFAIRVARASVIRAYGAAHPVTEIDVFASTFAPVLAVTVTRATPRGGGLGGRSLRTRAPWRHGDGWR